LRANFRLKALLLCNFHHSERLQIIAKNLPIPEITKSAEFFGSGCRISRHWRDFAVGSLGSNPGITALDEQR
jgi:hypothetical protein